MPILGNTSAGWKNIVNPFVNVSGAWKAVTNGWNNVAGVWKRCFGNPLIITVSTNTTYGVYVNGSGISGTATSSAVTCSVMGAVGGVTYNWVRVSGDSGTNANTGTAATTTWSRSATPPNSFASSWVCMVQDSAGNMGVSPPVSVNLLFIV